MIKYAKEHTNCLCIYIIIVIINKWMYTLVGIIYDKGEYFTHPHIARWFYSNYSLFQAFNVPNVSLNEWVRSNYRLPFFFIYQYILILFFWVNTPSLHSLLRIRIGASPKIVSYRLIISRMSNPLFFCSAFCLLSTHLDCL